MTELIMSKPQQVRKPRKGDCGTCHWFERAPQEPKAGNPWSGICLYNPPIAGQTMMPQMGPQGMQATPMFQGIAPPVSEIGRCHLWTSQRQYYDGEEHGSDSAKIKP
jgi:hypothetical protein